MGWRLKKDYNNSDNWYFFKITDHGKNKKTGKIERDEDPLSEEEIVECGFDLEWNYSQALEFYDNTFKPNQKILKIESKINAHKRVSRRKFKKSIFLPPHLVKKFYNDFLLEKYPSPEKKNKDDKTKKLLKGYDGYWNTAQDVIAEVCVKPEDYFMKPAKFYLYAIERGLSPSWFKKIIRFINLWGYFYSVQTKKPFLKIPSPEGQYRERLYDSYHENKKEGLESDPITFDILNKIEICDEFNNFDYKNKMESKHFKFLYIGCAFGLRPSETKRLLTDYKRVFHKIEKDRNGITCLHVNQPKLITLAKDKRWKVIPVLYEEQEIALKYIKEGKFKIPLTKTIHRLISPRHNNYGVRKGFFDTMV